MFNDDYCTEAEALNERYDGGFDYDFEPYSTAEKADFIRAKNYRFLKRDVGKFVVAQTPRKNKSVVKLLYLVDRSRTKAFWWSHDALFAMVFEKKEAAEFQAKRYKYNKARVIEVKPWMADLEGFEQEYGEFE